MIRTFGLALAAATCLAACDQHKAVDEHNASVSQVANAVAAAHQQVHFNPGRWESTIRVVDVKAPNMPPQTVAMMKSMFGNGGKSVASCLSKEEAAKPNAAFFNNAEKSCTFDHYTLGGGKLDATMRCGAGAGRKADVTMKGDYAPDHFSIDMVSATSDQAGRIEMHMAVDSKFAGACNGTEIGTKG